MPLTVRPLRAILRGACIHDSLFLRIPKGRCYTPLAGVRWQSLAATPLHDDKPYYITTPIFYVNAGTPFDRFLSLHT